MDYTINPFLSREEIDEWLANYFKHPLSPTLHDWLAEEMAQLWYPQRRGIKREVWQALVADWIAAAVDLNGSVSEQRLAGLDVHGSARQIAKEEWQDRDLAIAYGEVYL